MSVQCDMSIIPQFRTKRQGKNERFGPFQEGGVVGKSGICNEVADGNGFVGEPTEGNPTKPPIFLNIPNLKDWVLTPKLDKKINSVIS